jgi:hypothetical protein
MNIRQGNQEEEEDFEKDIEKFRNFTFTFSFFETSKGRKNNSGLNHSLFFLKEEEEIKLLHVYS